MAATEKPSCAGCKWNEDFECRRFPPTASIIMMPTTHPISHKTSLQPTPVSSFPNVQAELWCGEWAPKPSSLLLN
jgi:hypothetical protein